MPGLIRREERQSQILCWSGAAARGFLEGGVAAMKRILRLPAFQNLLDGEDLEFRIGGAISRFVEASLGGFLEHGLGGRLETEKDTHLGFLPGENAKVTHRRHTQFS